jgi:hypothetical protein
MTLRASPPTRPNDFPPASPRRTESFMTAQRSRKVWTMRSWAAPFRGLGVQEDLVERAAGSVRELEQFREAVQRRHGSPFT